MAKDSVQVIRDLFSAWNRGFEPAVKSIDDHFADDATWIQPGIPTTSSKTQAIELMRGFGGVVDRIDVKLLAIAGDGDTVLATRVDDLVKDGKTILSVEIAAAFELENGKIKRWTEYFDPRPVLKMMGG